MLGMRLPCGAEWSIMRRFFPECFPVATPRRLILNDGKDGSEGINHEPLLYLFGEERVNSGGVLQSGLEILALTGFGRCHESGVEVFREASDDEVDEVRVRMVSECMGEAGMVTGVETVSHKGVGLWEHATRECPPPQNEQVCRILHLDM